MAIRKIDWYAHYKQKFSSLDFKPRDLKIFYQKNKTLIDRILQLKPKRIIEAGCGLARDSLVLASRNVAVTVFDLDQHLLDLTSHNAARVGVSVNTLQGNLFQFSRHIEKNRYDLSFSGGVLEHYADEEIRLILTEQLKVVPVVFFTVPIYSDRNQADFNDSLYRRLLSLDEWRQILSPFSVVYFQQIRNRHDSLLAVLKR